MEEPWPGTILLQGSEDMGIYPGGLQGKKPDHLARCSWVPGWRWPFFGNGCFRGWLGTTEQAFLCGALIPW